MKIAAQLQYPPSSSSPYVQCNINYPPETTSDIPAVGNISDIVGSDALSYGAGAALVFHGYRRTGSVFWALLYGLAGKKVPVVAVPIALAQGFGKRKGCPTP